MTPTVQEEQAEAESKLKPENAQEDQPDADSKLEQENVQEESFFEAEMYHME